MNARGLTLFLVCALFVAQAFAINTYEQAVHYAKTHPTRDGGTWNQWCAAFVFRAGNLPARSARPSAIIAARASKIVSKNVAAAPAGTFHWWDIGPYGHVALATGNGGSLMASRWVTKSWGNAMGEIGVVAYTRKTGARYLGWSYDYAGSELVGVRKSAAAAKKTKPATKKATTKPKKPTAKVTKKATAKPTKKATSKVTKKATQKASTKRATKKATQKPTTAKPAVALAKTSTASTGIVGKTYNKRLQFFAKKHGYTGPINGVPGVNTWIGVQKGLRKFDYQGPADGKPGKHTYMAMQRAAEKYGYKGPVNGVLGPNSYKGFAKYLNSL